MHILVFNAGSSSLRFALFEGKNKRSTLELLYKGHVDAIGQKHCQFRRYFENNTEERNSIAAKNHQDAVQYALKRLQSDGFDGAATQKVAHRVVHGGETFTEPTRVTGRMLRQLKGLSSLAPLHNPANLAALRAARKALPKAQHYAVFDTGFHSTLPEHAFLYGLPHSLYKKDGIRRYGFHGSSHKYVAHEATRFLREHKLLSKRKPASLITCHMGNGISLAAVKNGRCLDTSMGFTPLEGPLMGTRSGSFDPAILFHLAEHPRFRRKKDKLAALRQLVEKESGFLGVSEISSDVRQLWAKPKSAGTKRAFGLISYQMAKHIASYWTPLGGPPNAIVFTAGIGQHAHYLRKQICDHLNGLGVQLKNSANLKNAPLISSKNSSVHVLVLPTQEERQMAREIRELK